MDVDVGMIDTLSIGRRVTDTHILCRKQAQKKKPISSGIE